MAEDFTNYESSKIAEAINWQSEEAKNIENAYDAAWETYDLGKQKDLAKQLQEYHESLLELNTEAAKRELGEIKWEIDRLNAMLLEPTDGMIPEAVAQRANAIATTLKKLEETRDKFETTNEFAIGARESSQFLKYIEHRQEPEVLRQTSEAPTPANIEALVQASEANSVDLQNAISAGNSVESATLASQRQIVLKKLGLMMDQNLSNHINQNIPVEFRANVLAGIAGTFGVSVDDLKSLGQNQAGTDIYSFDPAAIPNLIAAVNGGLDKQIGILKGLTGGVEYQLPNRKNFVDFSPDDDLFAGVAPREPKTPNPMGTGGAAGGEQRKHPRTGVPGIDKLAEIPSQAGMYQGAVGQNYSWGGNFRVRLGEKILPDGSKTNAAYFSPTFPGCDAQEFEVSLEASGLSAEDAFGISNGWIIKAKIVKGRDNTGPIFQVTEAKAAETRGPDAKVVFEYYDPKSRGRAIRDIGYGKYVLNSLNTDYSLRLEDRVLDVRRQLNAMDGAQMTTLLEKADVLHSIRINFDNDMSIAGKVDSPVLSAVKNSGIGPESIADIETYFERNIKGKSYKELLAGKVYRNGVPMELEIDGKKPAISSFGHNLLWGTDKQTQKILEALEGLPIEQRKDFLLGFETHRAVLRGISNHTSLAIAALDKDSKSFDLFTDGTTLKKAVRENSLIFAANKELADKGVLFKPYNAGDAVVPGLKAPDAGDLSAEIAQRLMDRGVSEDQYRSGAYFEKTTDIYDKLAAAAGLGLQDDKTPEEAIEIRRAELGKQRAISNEKIKAEVNRVRAREGLPLIGGQSPANAAAAFEAFAFAFGGALKQVEECGKSLESISII